MSFPNTSHSAATLTQPTNQKKTVELAFSYHLFILDSASRWAVLYAWKTEWLPTWLFVACQCFVIPFVIVVFFIVPRDEAIKAKYKVDEASPKNSFLSVLAAFSAYVIGVIVVYQISKGAPPIVRFLLIICTVGVHAFYVGMLYISSTSMSLPKVRQPKFPTSSFDPDTLERVDSNDLQIVWMETEVQSITQRVEAYTLESTLFGALAFSGFLTILASDRPIITSLEAMKGQTNTWLDQLLTGRTLYPAITFEQELGVVAAETLLCSMFFLAVVLSRLRFYSMLRQVQYAVQIARTWNNKEETVLASKSVGDTRSDGRLEQLSELVSGAILHAEPLISDLRGITRYISVFRNIGVFTFVAVLFTSAFVIAPMLGVIFVGIALMAFLYSSVDHWLRHRTLKGVPFFRRLSDLTHHRRAQPD
jgi:uncharacterized membrane protein YjjP (DUF1212 family)